MTPSPTKNYTNPYFESLPIGNTHNFDTTTTALKSLATLQSLQEYHPSHTLPASLEGRISDLQESQEKEPSIANQEIRNPNQQNQSEMAPYQFPLPSAPTITDEELLQLQRQYKEVPNTPNFISNSSIQEPQAPSVKAQIAAPQDGSSINFLSNYGFDNSSLIEIARIAARQTGESPREDKRETSAQQISLIQKLRNFSNSKIKQLLPYFF